MKRILFIYLLTLTALVLSGQKKPDTPLRQSEVVPDSDFRMRMENDRWSIGEPKIKSLPDSSGKSGLIDLEGQLIPAVPDSLSSDTLNSDSIKKVIIEAPIDYVAEDSIVVAFDGQKVYLYNNAKINYQDIELTANFMILDLETKEIYAEGTKDTT